MLFLALQLTLLAVVCLSTPSPDGILLAHLVPSAAAAIGVCLLSRTEHRRSVTPSTLIVLYLLASLTLDSIWLLIPSLALDSRLDSRFLLVQLAAKATLLAVECPNKEKVLVSRYQELSPEERSGVLQRVFFWYINPVLVRGYDNILVEDDLPSLDRQTWSGELRQSAERVWKEQCTCA